MTPEQEAKFEKWNDSVLGQPNSDYMMKKTAWEACLKANGYVQPVECVTQREPSESKAPEWVIDMMQNWKPVLCKVWSREVKEQERIIRGYIVDEFAHYLDEYGEQHDNAVPIPAWEPQDDEAVFYMNEDGETAVGKIECNGQTLRTITGSRYDASRLKLKPFDASAIGKPWSEIS